MFLSTQPVPRGSQAAPPASPTARPARCCRDSSRGSQRPRNLACRGRKGCCSLGQASGIPLPLSALLQLSSETGPAPLGFLGLPHARAVSAHAPTRHRNRLSAAPILGPWRRGPLFPRKETAPILEPQHGPIFEPARPAAHFKLDKTCNQNTAALTEA